MLKKLALYFGLALSLSGNVFAIVGGPFDGGDSSLILDDVGIYQASFRFKNGNGFAQWGNNVDLGPSTSTSANGSAASTDSSIGSVLNRSLLYYKGITFFGNATGIADFEAKTISGMSNTQSEVTLSNQTTTTSNNSFFLFGTSNQVQATSTAVNNGGRGFVANLGWEGKIKKTSPVFRFTGKGELTVLGADVQTILSNLAQQIVTQGNTTTVTLAAPEEPSAALIPTGPSTTGRDTYVALYNGYLAAIQAANAELNAINPLDVLADPAFIAAITPKTLEEVQESAEVVKVKVYGTRRYFLSQRQ